MDNVSILEKASFDILPKFPESRDERMAMLKNVLWKVLGGATLGLSLGSAAGLARRLLKDDKDLTLRPKKKKLQKKIFLPVASSGNEEVEPVKLSQDLSKQSDIMDYVRSPLDWASSIPQVVFGVGSKWGKKGMLPLTASVLATGLGAYGGYRVVDKMLRSRETAHIENKIVKHRGY